MENLLKVSGHEGLVKDPRSSAVISDDLDALNRAKEIKRKRLAEIQRLNTLESKVESLEAMIKQILESKENG